MNRVLVSVFLILAAASLVGCVSSGGTMEKNESVESKTVNTTDGISRTEEMMSMMAKGLAFPPRTPIVRYPDEYGMEYEEVSFTTDDGIVLKGWFIPADSNRIVISNHFGPGNRYGYPGHMEPWNASGGGFEVNFLPKYKALHEAGYNVLAYDMRNHGESGEANGGITGVGFLEWQDVLASLKYVRERFPSIEISLQSMCMGASATLNAMDKAPEAFEGIRSMILLQPLNGETTVRNGSAMLHIDPDEGVEAFDRIYNEMTGMRIADHTILDGRAEWISMPTMVLQVRNDASSSEQDIQTFYDSMTMEDKKMLWVENTPWRYHGYSFFSDHPEEMIEWYDNH